MKRPLIYILSSLILVECINQPRPPKVEDVLIDYVDDLKHLMVIHEIDTVFWVFRSKSYPQEYYAQNDTVYRLYRVKDTIYAYYGQSGEYSNTTSYNSLGLPVFHNHRGSVKYSTEFGWISDEYEILRVENPSSKTPDSTFYNFENGQLMSRFHKKGNEDWEYAQYSYNSDGELTLITDTMIQQVNHHYYKYEKEYFWKNSTLVKVKSTYIPGKKILTLFDSAGFPKKKIEMLENGDTAVFEIIKP